MTAQEIALQREIEKLRQQNEEMRKLATFEGFYKEYFDSLNRHPSQEAAFNEVNDRYHELFGAFRYNDWNSFRQVKVRIERKKGSEK